MKLLFDQNISFQLTKQIIDLFPNSKQVRELGLENSTDTEIFDFVKKMIWIKTGNTTTKNLENLLRKRNDFINCF